MHNKYYQRRMSKHLCSFNDCMIFFFFSGVVREPVPVPPGHSGAGQERGLQCPHGRHHHQGDQEDDQFQFGLKNETGGKSVQKCLASLCCVFLSYI